MSVRYYKDSSGNKCEEIKCDMPSYPSAYCGIVRMPGWLGPVKTQKNGFQERESGWVTFKHTIDGYPEERTDYCPICARMLGIVD